MDFFDLKYDFESSSIKLDEDSTFYFYAHPNEFLHEHLDKTLLVFKELINENILFKFYTKFYENNLINLDFEDFKNTIFDCVSCHDLGKISFNFQINRLNKYNPEILDIQKDLLKKYDFLGNIGFLTPNHSFTSSLLFLSKFGDFDSNSMFLLILSYIINSHHTRINDVNPENGFTFQKEDTDKYAFDTFKLLSLYLDIFSIDNLKDDDKFMDFQKNVGNFFKKILINLEVLFHFFICIYIPC